MHSFGMQGARLRPLAVVVLVVALALVATPQSPAVAVGTGNPVILEPGPADKHFNGFTGPFVVSFEEAPKGSYSYYVATDPPGGSTQIIRGPITYTWTGVGANPQFKVASLPPGTSYRFHVGDSSGHEADLPFVVSEGKAPSCSILLPNQVRMNARSELLRARLAPDCAAADTGYASWEARIKSGFAQSFIFDGRTETTWRLYDDEQTGTYVITPNSAKTTDNVHLPQNTRRLVMKLDSRVALSARRTGASVTLAASLRKYSPSANRFRSWAGRTVVLSYRTCSTCDWHRLKVRTTDRHGKVSYRFRAARTRQYRALVSGTASVWAPRVDTVRG